MALNKFQEIPVNDLKVGMFVSDLDRDWIGTPFPLQGFLLASDSQISEIKMYCSKVYIDAGKSDISYKTKALLAVDSRIASVKEISGKVRKPLGKTIKETFSHTELKNYDDKASFDEELTSAKVIFQEFRNSVSQMFDSIARKEVVSYRAAKEMVKGMVGSLVRNPKACMLLQQIKCKGGIVYDHSIGVSVWAAAIGRQIGLPEKDLTMLAVSGLLCDIGKTLIPDEILYKNDSLTEEEMAVVREHVNTDGVYKKYFSEMPEVVLETIVCHHERHDGSGYPANMAGDQIPVYARIVGLVDSYVAMTNFRPYSKTHSSYTAAKELYEQRDILFQAEIVEEFIQAVGLYPAGTFVELNTGEVGLVVEVYKTKRLRPKILLVLDHEKQRLKEVRYVNLIDCPLEEMSIVKCLAPDAYGLDKDVLI